MGGKMYCPNCGNQNLFLVVVETTETNFLLSHDGVWMSRPISDAYGKFVSHDKPKILSSKMTLFCHYCGQENDAVLDSKNPCNLHFTLGEEINHGASFTTMKETDQVIID